MGRAHEVRAASMAKTAAKKSKLNAKYSVQIFRAAKNGVPDPELNQILKKEIDKAKKAQIPADVIKKAIEKAKGGSQDDYSEVTYEAFGPNNSLFMIECLTDNVNRTYTEIRTIILKAGCKIGVPGSVQHMFNSSAIFSFEGLTEEEVLDILIMADCDVDDIETEDGLVTVYAPSSEYAKIRDALNDAKEDLELLEDLVAWVPMMKVNIEADDDVKIVKRLMDNLDENDDVQNVFHNIENISDIK